MKSTLSLSSISASKFFSVIAAVVILSACGSGGGNKSTNPGTSSSSSSSGGSTKPDPITNKINVKVTGLKGELELVNGADVLSITADGNWLFSKAVEVGVSYNVQLTKQPESQICSVKNGRRLMVSGSQPVDVEVACSNGFGISLDITKPRDYSLKNLSVISNYQRIGGADDLPLTLESKIKTSINSFIALKNNESTKAFYLSYVSDESNKSIKLDGVSTALALLIAEPVVTDAIAARGITPKALFELIAPLDAQKNPQLDTDMRRLAEEITRQADKHVDLFSVQSSLPPLIEKAIASSLDKINLVPLLTAPGAKEITDSLQAESGLSIKLTNLNAEKVQLSIKNNYKRSVSFQGAGSPSKPLIIPSLGATTIEQSIEAGKFYNLSYTVTAPGKLGTIDVLDAGYKAAVVRTAQNDYFIPNLVYFSGGNTLAPEAALDCFDEVMQKDLAATADDLWPNIQSLLEQDAYYRAFYSLADRYRTFLSNTDQIKKLVSCSSIGLSGLTDAEKIIATSHLSSLFSGLSKIREPKSVSDDLFRSDKQSDLIAAIIKLSGKNTIVFSNAFKLDVNVPNSIDDETEAEFSARCLDGANKPVACNVSWTIEDVVLAGQAIKYSFKKAQNQFISVVAVGPDGASLTNSIPVVVQRKSAGISISKKDSSKILSSGDLIEFDRVFSGTKLPQTLVVTNSGNAPLIISQILIEGSEFSGSISEATIGIGESKSFDIIFSPTEVKNYVASLTITSNDKSLSSLKLSLSGTGTAPVSIGKYQVVDNGIAKDESVASTNETPISGDENFSQVRLFGSTSSVFPQISLRVVNFKGPGSYSLADIDTDGDGFPEENCLALYAAAKDFTQQYCTNATTPAGRLVVTESDALNYQLDYDFWAVSCLVPTGGLVCEQKTIQLRGTTKVAKAVLQPIKP
jgi:hypothetical protein